MNTNPDGTVGIDLAILATELEKTKHVHHEGTQRLAMHRIQIEALIDIAVSLRVVAAEASAAMPADYEAEPTPFEPEDDEPVERDFLIVGDLVHILDDAGVHEVLKVGVSEGEAWAEIEDGGIVRYWQRNLVRLRGDEGDQPDPLAEVVVSESGTIEIPREPEIVAQEIAADLDDEFEGDDFVEAESALEKLRKLEKKPKAKTAAKGKKS